MNDVIVTHDGTTDTFTQEQILSPKFDCDGCMTEEDYVRRVGDFGLVTVQDNGDGTFTYKYLSPHCICEVEFTKECV